MTTAIGQVREIRRYPVKSMLGEEPERVTIGASGIPGDRAWALVDAATGKVASAKQPRLWGELLGFRAVYLDGAADPADPRPDAAAPGPGAAGPPPPGPVEITDPTGARVRSDDPAVDDRLSAAVGRPVRLSSKVPDAGQYDYVWEVDGLAPQEIVSGSQTGVTEEGRPLSAMPLGVMAPGTFQDVAPVTVMTTAALAAMGAVHPDGRWDPARFRSNLLLEVDGDGIVENEWVGRRLTVGGAVLEVAAPTPRCVMTTLPQGDLPRDRRILQAVARENRRDFAGLGQWACLGAYATVVEPGEVAVGDPIRLGT
ncbi:MAG TPA: MOSC domain-containing protein [Acidimicrobiales bacterium]